MEKFERVSDTKFINKENDHGFMGGTVIYIDNETDLPKAKKDVVETMCSHIRDIAETHDDFFIIKKAPIGDGMSVAAKFILPTVKEE